tara:strand:- start:247 stop:681 length:435 start_codon:yes stop_codon:yes gene_type:complete
MPVSPSEYLNQLDNLEKSQKVIMEKYKSALIDYKANSTNENKQIYEKYKYQLETDIGSKVFLLENNINKSISQNNISINENDQIINQTEDSYNNKIYILKEKRGTNLAANPFKVQKKIEMIEEYLYLGYYSIAIIIGGFFLYKH